ncbi:uncharacterized protein LOC109720994 [Ananas comosus]|uniref:Uncharacterized protein LOC109720994 n=1 Tax=Ananas comosus TaxID=4615 RepID=A0A6P5G5U9_ANACO|nr:uncharacterized protein LOC109720994 [Ananas comosus]
MKENLERNEKECMKIAILKHEETFRQQVRELHRLYRVQKQLMTHMKDANQPSYHYSDRTKPSFEVPAQEYNENEYEESDLELTLATGISGNQKRRKETSLTTDSGPSFSSSSTDSGGQIVNNNRRGLFQQSNVAPRLQNERKSGFNIDDHMKQDGLKHPPWFYQCLNLNIA